METKGFFQHVQNIIRKLFKVGVDFMYSCMFLQSSHRVDWFFGLLMWLCILVFMSQVVKIMGY